MKSLCLFAATLFLCVFQAQGATATINGTQTSQVIDGFGVNANHRSWNGEELKPVIDSLIDQGGMTLFRVIYDNSDWETANDNSDSNSFNWTYYNNVYGSVEFNKLWDMVKYLNQRGITDGAVLNFMGYGPAWLCGSSNFQQQSLIPGLEDEWAEMITSALYYARNTKNLQFRSVMPNNEPDTTREGIRLTGAAQYVTTIRKLAQKFDANGLGDLRIVGPDLTTGDTQYLPEIMADSLVMSKIEHFGLHNYGSTNLNITAVQNLINGSAFSNRSIWMTEFNVWCYTCDDGTRGTYDWSYCRDTANYLLNYLAAGATAGFVYEGYDSYYAHHGAWGFWGLFAVDNENAAVKTYTPRKNFYTVAQISKFVRPGAQRVNISGSLSPFSPLLAFKHSALGQVTLVGINTSGSSSTLTGTLTAMPTVTSLDLYYTSASANLTRVGSIPVNNGTFSANIPGDCVFTLVGSTGGNVTVAINTPTNGTQFTAPADISVTATAQSSAGSIELVGLYSGATKIGESTAPYNFTWSNVPMGDYSLTALAVDVSDNVGTSNPVNIAVLGPAAQLTVAPASSTIPAGSTLQFSVTLKDQIGHTLPPQTPVSWSVNAGGTINTAGLFTAGTSAGGPFSVTATYAGLTGVAPVNISAVNNGTIGNTSEGTLTDSLWDSGTWINAARFQASSNITVSTVFAKITGVTGKYKCAVYAGNSSQPTTLLTSAAEITNPSSGWQAFTLPTSLSLTSGSYYWLAVWSDSPNAKVYYSGTNGTLRWARLDYAAWPASLTTSGGNSHNYCIYASGSTSPSLNSISVSPNTATISSGATQQFSATGLYSDSTTQNLSAQVTWISSSTNRATINSAGLATGVSAGTTTISASIGTLSASSTLVIQTPVVLSSITVSPAATTVVVGSTQQFTATGTYSDTSTQNLTGQVTWTSSVTARATVNSAGLATGISAGTTTISAALSGVTGSTTLSVQALPVSITTSTLVGGTTGASYSATLSGSGGTAPYLWSLSNGVLPSGLALSSGTGIIAGTPTASGTFNVTFQLSDTSSPVQTATKAFTITIASASVSLWPSSTVPSIVDGGADSSVELGVKFRSDVAGTITGIRYYKASANTGTHVGNLWSSTGTLLASATFSNETSSGWQQVIFSTPVTIAANTVYIASYHANNGHYSVTQNYFTSTGMDTPPLHALRNGVSGGNGVYRYGTGNQFPNATWNNANYWVDVLFKTADTATLTAITVTPANPTVTVGATQQFTATGTYSNATTQNLTTQVTWASSNTARATINTTGLATSISAGSTTVSATLAGVVGSTNLTVQAAPITLTSITVTPANPTVTVGATQQFTATGTYSNATTQNLTTQVTWASSNTARATINITGLATIFSTGSTTISATLDGVVGSTNLTVQPAPVTLTSITLTPANATAIVGATQQFSATGTYSDSTTQNLTSQVAWVSSVPARATISGGGLATVASAGTTTISATLGSISGSTTLTVQPPAPTISTSSLPSGVAGSAYSTSLAASGGTTPFAWSILSGSLPSGLSLNATTGTINGTPTVTSTFNFTVQLSDDGNPTQTATKSLSITIAPAVIPIVSLWPNTSVPAQIDGGADSSVELGVKFRSDVAGTIIGIRYYKASANTGTHVGNLWSSTGTLLASATFSNETSSGWQQVIFSTPVTIAANTVYIASYHANNGHYSVTQNYFTSTGMDTPPLHALRNGVSGGNGVYRYGTGNQFPDATWNNANYWVDVLFKAAQ